MLVGKEELAFTTNDIVRTPGFPCLIKISINRDGLLAIQHKIWGTSESMSVVKVQQ